MNMIETPRKWRWLRYAGWGAAAAFLLAHVAAMRFAPDSGVDWSTGDFIFAGILFGIVGVGLELAVRATSNWPYRAGSAVALGTGLLLVWANLAVGYVGSEDNPYNQYFFGVVAIAFIGSAIAQFRARGVAWALTAAGIAHAVVGAVGFPQDTRTAPMSIIFTGLWLTAALLFRKSARDQVP